MLDDEVKSSMEDGLSKGNGGGRRPLTREVICEAALEAIDEHGLERVSMRALADALGVKASSLYYHFGSKGELLAGVADSLYRSLDGLPEEDEWSEQVRWSFRQLHGLVLAHPNAAPLLLRELTHSPVARERSRLLLRGLSQAGLISDGRSALIGNLVALVIGHSQLAAWERNHDEIARLLQRQVPRDDAGDGDGLFEAGLEAIIAAYAPV
jgi:AcrR family transcriptional regulator